MACPYCEPGKCLRDIDLDDRAGQMFDICQALCPGIPTMGPSLHCDMTELVRRLVKEKAALYAIIAQMKKESS